MNHTSSLDLLFGIFQSFVSVIFTMLGSELFWIFIIALMSLGRWLLLQETLHFAGKKNENLTPVQKKKRKNLLFFGRGLLGIGLAFFSLLLIILLIPTKN